MPDDLQQIDYATPFPKRKHRSVFWLLLVVIPLLVVVLLGVLWIAARTMMVRGRMLRAQAATIAQSATIAPSLGASRFPMTISQRRSQPMPGSNGSVIASIGDITHGQTLLSINDNAGNASLHTTSVREGDILPFTVAGASFEIEVVELKNFLTSEDFGVFSVRLAGAGISEQEKIERLINAVADARGLIFIRNGEEHSPAEAAKHLKSKYRSADNADMSARKFIDELASRSSTSGEAYRVRQPDGREIEAREYFIQRLAEIEGAHAGSTSRPAR